MDNSKNNTLTKGQQRTIRQALTILRSIMQKNKVLFTEPSAVRDYLRLKLGGRHNEVFLCLYLDSQHRLIECRELFFGTIDGAFVHPREVVREVLQYNAAAVLFAHNHPSGIAKPSQADKRITKKLKAALELIDVRVLDHFVIGEQEIASFAEQGLL